MRLVVGPTRMAFQGLADPTSAWFEDAACKGADVDLFFLDRGVKLERENYREAKTYCARCSVRSECLDYAIANNLRHGLFGGRTERERREIERARRRT